jgi:hypothetical protein
LLLILVIFGWTLTVPFFVWCQSTSVRQAWAAWWFFARYLLCIAVPAAIASAIGWLP